MSRPPVPLPSIRDIFPEMSIPKPTSPASRHRLPPSPPPSSSSSDSTTRRVPDPKPSNYSFNVLRADPVTAALEHVASSTTLRPRAASAAAHPGMHGAAPVFRVAISPTDHRARHRQHRAREILPDTRERHPSPGGLPPSIPREADLAHLRSPSSTILSFPVSDHPVPSPISSDARRLHLRSEIPGAALQGEGRGKKHQCPHCGKRFNRPSSMKIHVNTHTGAKPYRCPYPGCGREFNVNSNMRRHWRNHSRSATRLPDPDVARPAVYHPHSHHLPPHRLDPLPHHALMSPPATNSSMSEENSDDDPYSDDEQGLYPMDIDDDDHDRDDGTHLLRNAPGGGPHAHPPPPPAHPAASLKPSAGSSPSSDVSVWSRPASPARALPSSAYGAQLHRHAYPNPHPLEDRHALSHPHAHPQGQAAECMYRPSIAAYAISTDSKVSTALRPAFTSPCTARDRDRDRDRYHARSMSGGGRDRERHHPQGYPSRG